jgi:hypothetical protein
MRATILEVRVAMEASRIVGVVRVALGSIGAEDAGGRVRGESRSKECPPNWGTLGCVLAGVELNSRNIAWLETGGCSGRAGCRVVEVCGAYVWNTVMVM